MTLVNSVESLSKGVLHSPMSNVRSPDTSLSPCLRQMVPTKDGTRENARRIHTTRTRARTSENARRIHARRIDTTVERIQAGHGHVLVAHVRRNDAEGRFCVYDGFDRRRPQRLALAVVHAVDCVEAI